MVKDRFPAYISWQEFELNQRQLADNRWPVRGDSSGLLCGLLRCAHCGRHMNATYKDGGIGLRYICPGERVDYGGDRCQSIQSKPVDAHINELVMLALSPAALDISLQVASDVEADRERQHDLWDKRLARAEHDVAHARRQYDAVDPANRLVAQNLEDRWENTLVERQRLYEEYRRFSDEHPPQLSQAEREQVRCTSAGIVDLWRDGVLTNAEKAQIVRLMVSSVSVDIIDNSERVILEVHWHGERVTRDEIRRSVLHWRQLSNFEAISARVQRLSAKGVYQSDIARTLNEAGWQPARQDRFTVCSVQSILRVNAEGSRKKYPKRPQPEPVDRSADEWMIPELSERIGIPKPTLFGWIHRGWVDARKELPHASNQSRRRWLIHANDSVLEAMREWHEGKVWKKPRFQRPSFRTSENSIVNH